MRLANDLTPGIAADLQELVVDRNDLPRGIGHGKNGVLVQRPLIRRKIVVQMLRLCQGLAYACHLRPVDTEQRDEQRGGDDDPKGTRHRVEDQA